MLQDCKIGLNFHRIPVPYLLNHRRRKFNWKPAFGSHSSIIQQSKSLVFFPIFHWLVLLKHSRTRKLTNYWSVSQLCCIIAIKTLCYWHWNIETLNLTCVHVVDYRRSISHPWVLRALDFPLFLSRLKQRYPCKLVFKSAWRFNQILVMQRLCVLTKNILNFEMIWFVLMLINYKHRTFITCIIRT